MDTSITRGDRGSYRNGYVSHVTRTPENTEQRWRNRSEAQSEVVGVIFLLSISITAIGAILLLGHPIIAEVSGEVQFDRMENEFALLDAGISSTALGASESQSVSLSVEGGQIESNPDASWMKLEHSEQGEIANITIGNVRYVQDGKTLAYEGGGVWRSNEGEDFTEMISPPEFHYRDSTLSLPAYNITSQIGFEGTGNSLRIESDGDPALVFPNNEIDNPLQEGNVTITVKSEYYRGWESYFRDRTTGAIQEVNEEEQKVVFRLNIPTEMDLTGGGLKWITEWDEQGSVYVDEEQIDETVNPEELVNPMIDRCFPNPEESDCENLEDYTGERLDEDTIYYIDVEPGKTHKMGDYAAPNGNVKIVVNGNLAYYNEFAVSDGVAEPVEVYVDGHLNLQGNARINVGEPDGANVAGVSGSGKANSFITYITGGFPGDSDGGAGAGNAEYTGVVYAPNTKHNGVSPCQGGDKFAGTPTIKGAVIADYFCVSGDGMMQADDSLDKLDLSGGASRVRYLHVTENEIRLQGKNSD